MRRAALVLLLVAAGGCGHAERVAPPTAGTSTTVQKPGSPPVAASPEGILTREGVLQIQRALGAHGLGVELTGVLDDATVAALSTFQRQQGLAETGMPSMETLRKLGLDADAIYRGRNLGRG